MPQKMDKFTIKTLTNYLVQKIQNSMIGDAAGKLPSEVQMRAQYQVSRYTLRATLDQLGKLGYTYQAHGIGTFIRPHNMTGAISLQNIDGLTEEITRQGKTVKMVATSQKIVTVSEADFLPNVETLDAKQELLSVVRKRCIDGVPAIVEHSYYLRSIIDLFPNSVLNGRLFDYVEQQTKSKIGFIDSVIGCEPINFVTADFFKQPVGTASLVVQDDSYLSYGQLFAFSKIFYDAKSTKFFMFKKMD